MCCSVTVNILLGQSLKEPTWGCWFRVYAIEDVAYHTQAATCLIRRSGILKLRYVAMIHKQQLYRPLLLICVHQLASAGC